MVFPPNDRNIRQLSRIDEDCYQHLRQENLDVRVWQVYKYFKLCSPPVLHCTSNAMLRYLALQYQCCIITCVEQLEYCL